jgi:hypothetical protein
MALAETPSSSSPRINPDGVPDHVNGIRGSPGNTIPTDGPTGIDYRKLGDESTTFRRRHPSIGRSVNTSSTAATPMIGLDRLGVRQRL